MLFISEKNKLRGEKIVFKVIFLLTVFSGSVSFAHAVTYYVDKDSRGGACSDSKAGTITQPWCTVGKANSTLQAGDTVYIRSGTYTQQIKPANNGSSGNYITYESYGSEEVKMDLASGYFIDLAGKNYIKVKGIKIIDADVDADSWVQMSGTSYCVIENCYFKNNARYAGMNIVANSHHNKILNNTFIATCSSSGPTQCGTTCGGPMDLIWVEESSANLFEGNNFENAPHALFGLHSCSGHNIIRNNNFSNIWRHTLVVVDGTSETLVENNIMYNAGERYYDNWCTNLEGDRSRDRWTHFIKNTGATNIIRNNVVINHGAYSFGDGTINARVYNNTVYKNEVGIFARVETEPAYDNVFKNNIVSHSETDAMIFNFVYDGEDDNVFTYNNFYGQDVDYKDSEGSVSDAESAYPSEWIKGTNKSVDPKFVNASTQEIYTASNVDLHLQSTSPMIDAGTWLTTTKSAGSGTTISVNDAAYFTDGWGVIEGDVIQLENQTQTARITDVNYDTNTITIDESLTWNSGQGVSLVYSGSRPDMGAYEYGGEAPPPSCTENWTCTAWSAWSTCANNQQSHTRTCTDFNNCGTTTNKPAETETQVCSASSVNIASSAAVTASSESASTNQQAIKAVDTVKDGYPGDYTKEWATNEEGVGAWIKLSWASPQTIDKIILYDRPNTDDQILGGTITFSDGTIINTGTLNNDGTATAITFSSKTISHLTLTVNEVSAATENIGLSEIEIYQSGELSPPATYGLSDFVNLMTDWLKTAIGSPADVNNDGKVNSRDLGIMMHGWGG